MSALDYYTMLLRETRHAHRVHIREARKWRYFLRDACMDEARSCLRAARRYIKIIREARNGD
jgi:hypothetical protein